MLPRLLVGIAADGDGQPDGRRVAAAGGEHGLFPARVVAYTLQVRAFELFGVAVEEDFRGHVGLHDAAFVVGDNKAGSQAVQDGM